MLLFAVRPGYAIAVREAQSAPLMIGMTSWGDIASGGGFANQKAIITGIQLADQPNYQLQNMLDKFLYIYSFGNRAGDLSVSGIAFTGRCENGNAGPGDGGIDNVRKYYKKNRLSTLAKPIAVVLSGESFSALLVGCQVAIDNPQAGLGLFSFNFKTIPDA